MLLELECGYQMKTLDGEPDSPLVWCPAHDRFEPWEAIEEPVSYW